MKNGDLYLHVAWLPYQIARFIWIGLIVLFYWFGVNLALDVLEWKLSGWRRWLALLSSTYLFAWFSIRSEQLGTGLFLLTVLSLWGYQREKPWLAGMAFFWTYRNLPPPRSYMRWGVLIILVAIFSVPVWERPAYDGYWIVLGIVTLLLLTSPHLWRRSVRKVVP